MHNRFFFILAVGLFLIPPQTFSQVETRWIDTTKYRAEDVGYFFTNRPLKRSTKDEVNFRNRWTRQTGNLHFCLYNFDNDSIMLKYQAKKTSPKRVYPTEPVDHNFFYKIYQDFRIDRGIRNIVFIVPGMAKTFDEQLNDYMFRLQHVYADSLQRSTAFVTFAWGDQSMAEFYYKAKRSASHAANDFAVFQHMLEEFIYDSTFFAENPDDLSLKIVFMSEGNQLFKKYLLKREKRGIDLVPVYDRVVFIGSDASADSFEQGKGFHNLTQMTDSVLVLVNRIDGPLLISQYWNLKIRLGRMGPTNFYELPDNIVVRDITGLISWRDMPALGHDYFLRNLELRSFMLHEVLTYEPDPYRVNELPETPLNE